MMNFKDMGLEKFVRDYKDMNPDLLELSRELYKENKNLPDKYQLTNSQLDMEIRNNLGNAYTGLDLKNKKEALVKQEGLLQEILNGYDLVKQSIDEYSNKEKPEQDMNDKLNELATKAVQAVRDVPENVDVIKEYVQREIEHQLDPAVMKNTIEQGLVAAGSAVGGTKLNADEIMTKKQFKNEHPGLSYKEYLKGMNYKEPEEEEDKLDIVALLKKVVGKSNALNDGSI